MRGHVEGSIFEKRHKGAACSRRSIKEKDGNRKKK